MLEKKQSRVIIQNTFAPKPSKVTHTNRMESSESRDRIENFNALVLRHKAMIWHICSDYSLGRAWNIEDCIQEVMVSLWRDFDKFEGRSSEKTWVWRVATNTMLMLKRKDARSPQTESIETEGAEKRATTWVMTATSNCNNS